MTADFFLQGRIVCKLWRFSTFNWTLIVVTCRNGQEEEGPFLKPSRRRICKEKQKSKSLAVWVRFSRERKRERDSVVFVRDFLAIIRIETTAEIVEKEVEAYFIISLPKL